MRVLTRLLALSLFSSCAIGRSSSQEAKAPLPLIMVFHFQSEDMQVRYSIQLQSDGLGSYWQGPPDFMLGEAVGAKAITAGGATLTKIFAVTSAVKAGICETRAKNIAQTGRKTLLLMVEGTPKCEFNYSDNDRINEAAKAFAGIAETLRMGEKLTHDKRFDHLGLNADIEVLTTEAKAGVAIELQNIAPVLQSISDNDDLMDVVRRKAQSLLQDATLSAPEKK